MIESTIREVEEIFRNDEHNDYKFRTEQEKISGTPLFDDDIINDMKLEKKFSLELDE